MEDRREPEADGLHEVTDRGQNRERPLAGVHDSLQQYSTLLEINNAIISNLTQESLFHAISEALRTVVPFDRALLYVVEKDALRTVALEGRELEGHSHDAHRVVSPQGTAAGWAVEHRQPRLSHNLAVEPRLPGDEILFAGGVRSYLIVPLIARDRAIGAAGGPPEFLTPKPLPDCKGVLWFRRRSRAG